MLRRFRAEAGNIPAGLSIRRADGNVKLIIADAAEDIALLNLASEFAARPAVEKADFTIGINRIHPRAHYFAVRVLSIYWSDVSLLFVVGADKRVWEEIERRHSHWAQCAPNRQAPRVQKNQQREISIEKRTTHRAEIFRPIEG